MAKSPCYLGVFTALFLNAFAPLGCVSSGGRGHPLHGVSPLPEEQRVAHLFGYISTVDRNEVSAIDPPFELLPGCHIVTTRSRWNTTDSRQSFSVQTGVYQIPLPMKAGHSYEVRIAQAPDARGISVIYLDLHAVERDADGELTTVYGPVSGKVSPITCRSCEGNGGLYHPGCEE